MKKLLFSILLGASAMVGASSFTASAAVYDITRFGAVSDTTALSTAAIQSAIDSCHAGGGGTVIVPA
ncbi:MAG: hypothetical protein K2K47_10020, partial [Duncaniella sp.]|nr:hypothetical protein [Duncaniella sp.]